MEYGKYHTFSRLKPSLVCNLSLPTTENSDIIYIVILSVITPLLCLHLAQVPDLKTMKVESK